jgi:hypothetical protein
LVDRFCRNERLRVYIAHDAIAVCQIRGRFRATIAEKSIIQLPPLGQNASREIAEAPAALRSWMEARSYIGAIEWIVGFEHVRYLMLPWDERLADITFCTTLAEALFAQQLYGIDTARSSCEMRFAPLAYGCPRLAALIPKDVIRTLTALSDRQRWKVTAITPALAAVWDSFFDLFKKSTGTLALIEGQRLLRVDYERGNIAALLVRPFCDSRIEAARNEADFIFPATGDGSPGSAGLRVSGMTSDDDLRIAYALCGVH